MGVNRVLRSGEVGVGLKIGFVVIIVLGFYFVYEIFYVREWV